MHNLGSIVSWWISNGAQIIAIAYPVAILLTHFPVTSPAYKLGSYFLGGLRKIAPGQDPENKGDK